MWKWVSEATWPHYVACNRQESHPSAVRSSNSSGHRNCISAKAAGSKYFEIKLLLLKYKHRWNTYPLSVLPCFCLQEIVYRVFRTHSALFWGFPILWCSLAVLGGEGWFVLCPWRWTRKEALVSCSNDNGVKIDEIVNQSKNQRDLITMSCVLPLSYKITGRKEGRKEVVLTYRKNIGQENTQLYID